MYNGSSLGLSTHESETLQKQTSSFKYLKKTHCVTIFTSSCNLLLHVCQYMKDDINMMMLNTNNFYGEMIVKDWISLMGASHGV